jgi:outer membrane protein OmpA-like peptidoglycan-associated protein
MPKKEVRAVKMNRFEESSRPARKRLLSAATVCVVVLGTLTSCSLFAVEPLDCQFTESSKSENSYGSDVAVVIGPTDNFVDFRNAIEASGAIVSTALGQTGAKISVILADGRPALIRTINPRLADTPEGTEIINRGLLGSVRDVYFCTVGGGDREIVNPRSAAPETDVVAALSVAAGQVAVGRGESKHIVVIGNGLQTAGQYSFAKSGIPSEAQVGDIVGDLKSQGALPDLKGATVDFVGLGLVNSSEPPLNQQSLDGLVAFWRAIVAASGGYVGTIMTQVVDGAPSPDSIAVTAVEGLKDACINESVAESDGISFNPGNAEFIDVGAATATAQNIATKIAAAACPGDITVIGYVASATPQAQYVFGNAEDEQLSLARAEAFKALLINAGVATNIVTVGAGKGPVNDWDEAGNFVENLGQQNRKIVVTQ